MAFLMFIGPGATNESNVSIFLNCQFWSTHFAPQNPLRTHCSPWSPLPSPGGSFSAAPPRFPHQSHGWAPKTHSQTPDHCISALTIPFQRKPKEPYHRGQSTVLVNHPSSIWNPLESCQKNFVSLYESIPTQTLGRNPHTRVQFHSYRVFIQAIKISLGTKEEMHFHEAGSSDKQQTISCNLADVLPACVIKINESHFSNKSASQREPGQRDPQIWWAIVKG